ncbi:MAG: macB 1 [Verrucomicrobia bacterium]|jgi:putative ABC transport system permease protein|nr:macB 1 [Verrucomicrobiota bacterium]
MKAELKHWTKHLPVELNPTHLMRLFRLGLRSIWMHRLRSVLTMLGIVFGVCSVIAMLAIGEGASFEAQEQIKNLGSQNIILRSVKPPEEQRVMDKGSQSFVMQYGLTEKDIKRITLTIPGIESAIPARMLRDYVWNISRRVDTEIVATVTEYAVMRNLRVAKGRFFSDLDSQQKASVCVLGAEMAGALFPLDSPLGRDVRVGGIYYRVIGILEPQGKGVAEITGSAAETYLHRMFIPLETARLRYGEIVSKQRQGSYEAEKVQFHEVTVKVANGQEVVATSEAINEVMSRNHEKKDYQLVVPLELLQRAERTKYIFNIVLGSIAAISLLVGGIGIMNIMLASITERTLEIGIRRALGAKRQDIVWQFLIETTLLSASGGMVGVVLGLLIPLVVTQLAGMKTIITFWSPILAFTISALVGIGFGLYPAIRAAKMDPVEALRHQ